MNYKITKEVRSGEPLEVWSKKGKYANCYRMLLFFVLNIFHFVVGSNTRLVDDETYNHLLEAIDAKEIVAYSHTCPVARRVHDMQQDYVFSIEEKFNIAAGKVETLLLVEIEGRKVIFPRIGGVGTIIDFFLYKTYKGEGARKLRKRILMSYAGIVRNKLQTFLNEIPEHCREIPIFRNKPPLQTVVSHTPNSRHQIDLVCFEKDPQVRDGNVFMYVLSVLDVFSRYVFLRPATSKEPKEIKVSTFFLKLFLLLRIFICFSLLEQATYFTILETISAFFFSLYIFHLRHRTSQRTSTINI